MGWTVTVSRRSFWITTDTPFSGRPRERHSTTSLALTMTNSMTIPVTRICCTASYIKHLIERIYLLVFSLVLLAFWIWVNKVNILIMGMGNYIFDNLWIFCCIIRIFYRCRRNFQGCHCWLRYFTFNVISWSSWEMIAALIYRYLPSFWFFLFCVFWVALSTILTAIWTGAFYKKVAPEWANYKALDISFW